MAKLKNLSLNDSVIFKEGSNEGIFNQVTSAKGDSWYNTGITNSLYMMSILTGIIPLRTAMSGLISVKESGTLYTPSAGDTLTTVNFTDDNFSNYCSSDYTRETAIPRRYALSRYSNVSKFPYGILYSFDKSTYCVKTGEVPNYTNFAVPQGVFVVKLDGNGKMLVNTSSTTESTPWEVVFDNPFVIPSEVRNSLNDYAVETTGAYKFDNNTTISETYIMHNNGLKELYMRVFLANSGIPSKTIWKGDVYVLNIGGYTFSKSGFFTVTPDMAVDMVYCDQGAWPRGLVTPSTTSTGVISFASVADYLPTSITCQVHLTQIPSQGG